MDDQHVRRDAHQFPLADIESAGDALRLMTGADDPISERDQQMDEAERGGPFLISPSRLELSRPEDDASIDRSWSREAFPTAMRIDEAVTYVEEALEEFEDER